MAVTEQDRMATPVSGESTSGGPKMFAVDDSGQLKVSVVSDWMPADDDSYWLGDDTHGWKGVKFPDLKLYQLDADTLSLENIAGGTYKNLNIGALQVAGDIVPDSDGDHNIGSALKYFGNVYFKVAVYGGSVAGDWSPDSDNDHNLGTTLKRWAVGYINKLYADLDIAAAVDHSAGLTMASMVYDDLGTLITGQEYKATYFRYNVKSTTPGNPTATVQGVEGCVGIYIPDESLTVRGGYFRFYIDTDTDPTSTLRTGIAAEISPRASYAGGGEVAAEAGTAFVGARIWMAPYFSAATVDNVNNFWGLWIYGEHATQRNADAAIWISDAGGGFTDMLRVSAAGGADADVNIIKVSVTGGPRFFWDESEDRFGLSHGITFGGAVTVSTGGNNLLTLSTGSAGLVISTTGSVYINDTSNGNMTIGLTINEGANDKEVLALKSSTIAHGATTLAETDTFFAMMKQSGTGGGAVMRVLSDSDLGAGSNTFAVQAYSGIALDTTKSTAGLAGIIMQVATISGTGKGNITANGNIFAVRHCSDGTNWLTDLIVDEDGDLWLAGDITFAGDILSSSSITLQPSGDADDYFTFVVVSDVPTIYGTGAYVRIGDAAGTSHALASEDDLMVSGIFEVDGAAYCDASLYVVGEFTVTDVSAEITLTSSTGTNRAFYGAYNTGGAVYFGIESSIGAALLTGAAAYGGVINHTGNYPIHFGTNDILRMTLEADGDLVFATGLAIRSGVTNGNTLLIAANDTTFITLTTGATDTCDLATGVTIGTAYIYRASGTDVPVGDGGTGLSNIAAFGIYYASAADTLTVLNPNTAATKKFLSMTGTGAAGQAPSWEALVAGDIPDISATYVVNTGDTMTGDLVLDNTAVGADANSPRIYLRGNYWNDPSNVEVEAVIQLLGGADPYLRISVDDGGATPASVAVWDLHDTVLVVNVNGFAFATHTDAGDAFSLNAYRTHLNNLDYVKVVEVKNTATENGTGLLGFFGATAVAQQAYPGAALKEDYIAGDLDTEAEIITAINTINTLVNKLRTAGINLGLVAAS